LTGAEVWGSFKMHSMPIKSTIEIILKEDVQRLFDEFSSCFNMRVGFYSPLMEEIAVGLKKPRSQFCSLIRDHLNKKQKCRAIDSAKRLKALNRKDMITLPCFAGMIESIIPIYFDGIHLGFCMMGQYRNEDRLNQKLINEWCEHHGSSEKLVLEYLRTPCFSNSQIQSIRKLFRVIVDYIVSQNMISIKSNLIVERIINYAKDHINANLTIKEASAMVGRSESTISHLFTSYLKKNFKQIMIELKLEKAEEYFRDNPEITVKEIALQLGYDDPYYFSRLYKKYRGCAPSRYLQHSRI
jgi:AraC-like DNA-binding protein